MCVSLLQKINSSPSPLSVLVSISSQTIATAIRLVVLACFRVTFIHEIHNNLGIDHFDGANDVER
jgi:hypothetical protein